MRQHDPDSLPATTVFGGRKTSDALSYLRHESLARLHLAQECIRRSDAVLTQLASVWITADSARYKRP